MSGPRPVSVSDKSPVSARLRRNCCFSIKEISFHSSKAFSFLCSSLPRLDQTRTCAFQRFINHSVRRGAPNPALQTHFIKFQRPPRPRTQLQTQEEPADKSKQHLISAQRPVRCVRDLCTSSARKTQNLILKEQITLKIIIKKIIKNCPCVIQTCLTLFCRTQK